MTLASTLARGRIAAERLMVDAVLIRRVTGSSTDSETGAITPTYSQVYAGKGRVQQSSRAQARPQDAGEAYVLMLRLELQLPVTVTGLKVGDVVTVTASANDQDLLSRTYRIRDLMHKSHATARRVQIEEITS